MMVEKSSTPLLEVKDLTVHFPVTQGALLQRRVGAVKAVNGVSFSLVRGETLGLVGESGCGKSTTGRAIAQLLRPTSGQVFFDGQELTRQWRRGWGRWQWNDGLRRLRKNIQMVFQDPYASLNPRMTVESIIAEPLRTFGVRTGQRAVRQRVQDLMRQVGMDPRYIRRYPHEFSGGQRQRIGIARALALQPDLILCDEPISALDVSIQAQILNLLHELRRSLALTYIFIAHDLAAVRQISDRVAVMYLGQIVELADVVTLFRRPAHPYTRALISVAPIPDPKSRQRQRLKLVGEVPSPLNPPAGCVFHPRCPEAEARCRAEAPEFKKIGEDQWTACHLSG